MTRPDEPLRDELLSAWLDGELDPATRQRVQSWIDGHPDAAQRVERWAQDGQALRERLTPWLDEPVPTALARQVLRPRPSWPTVARAAGLLVGGIALGATLAWAWLRGGEDALAQRPVEWTQRAAVAHAVYTPEVRHPVEVKAQEEHLARWLTRRLAMPVKLFDLSEQGFELIGGRLLPDAAGPSAQLMYQNGAGQRVTVYLRKPEHSTPAAFRYEQRGELGLFYWVEGPTGYALVGTLPRSQLLTLAESIYRQQPAPASAPAR